MQKQQQDNLTCHGSTDAPAEALLADAVERQTAEIIAAARLWAAVAVCFLVLVAAGIAAARFAEAGNCASLSVLREAYSHGLLWLARE